MRNVLQIALLGLMSYYGTPANAASFELGLAAAQVGDFSTALSEWQPLAEQGNADAQYNLGLMHQRGNGVPMNYMEAARWYRSAVEQGYAGAQNNLGLMAQNGEGIPVNYVEAERLYRLAALQGYGLAQFNLGNMYLNGTGVLKDYSEASRLFRLAANQGLSMAQFNLGTMYLNGHGLRDYVLAHMWLNIASANGDTLGAENRDNLEKYMSSGQIAQATQLARACMASNYRDCG